MSASKRASTNSRSGTCHGSRRVATAVVLAGVFLVLTMGSVCARAFDGFTENEGQRSEKVLYYAEGTAANVYFLHDAVVLDIGSSESTDGDVTRSGCAVWLRFDGGSPSATVEARGDAGAEFNYFVGASEPSWRTEVPTYSEIVYRDAWPGIDLVYRRDAGALTFDVVSSEGTDLSFVGFTYEGADAVVRADEGIRIETPAGVLVETDDGSSGGRYVMADADEPDAAREDPATLLWSTLFGGSNIDQIREVAVDQNGDPIVCGLSYSSNLPTTVGAYDQTIAGADLFVAKFTSDGSTLTWCTFLGSDGSTEDAKAIALDPIGNAVVVGYTNHNTYPVTGGAYDTSFNFNRSVVVSKVSASGSSLPWSTYLGGPSSYQYQLADDVVVASDYTVYVTGQTSASDFPTTAGVYDQTHNGDYDAFACQLSSDGASLLWSTFLGGAVTDYGRGVDVDVSGNVFVVGETNTNYPTTPGAHDQFHNGGWDAFASMLSSDGTSLMWSTFLGGGGDDGAWSVDVDRFGRPVLAGVAQTAFPTTSGVYGPSHSSSDDVFVSKINPGDGTLVWSTYLGGSSNDEAFAVALDEFDCPVLTGLTGGGSFPVTVDALQATHGGDNTDGFVSKLDEDATTLMYSTFIGGGWKDNGDGVAPTVDATGDAFVSGRTEVNGFPTTTGAYDETGNGNWDGFLCKVDLPVDFGIDPGDLVVTEIIQNPDAVSDASGEWFELYNASGRALDLKWLLFEDDGTDDFIVDSSVIVDADAYALLAINGDNGTNGGLPPVDYDYDGFTLGNSDDEVTVTAGTVVVDRVAYDDGSTFPDPTGNSMYLTNITYDNNVGSNWAEDTYNQYGLGDYGTPGAPTIPPVNPGDLVITEIMKDPAAVADTDGEWFEVYNATGDVINMSGLVIKDDGTNSFTILGDVNVAAGGYALFARNGDVGTNGGLPSVDYVYSGMDLGNSDDEIVIMSGVTEIDRVAYTVSRAFPNPTGASMYLIDVAHDNNDGANWAEETWHTYGAGDYGTPDSDNEHDGDAPISVIDPLIDFPAESFFDVYYSADDGAGSGVDEVELFYRIDGGSYSGFGTFSSSPIAFVGGPDGFYEFYSVATDLAGNVEDAPTTPDASTTIDTGAPTVTGVALANLTLAHTDDFAKNGDYLTLSADVDDAIYSLSASDITADLSSLLAGGGGAVEAESYVGTAATWTVALEDVVLGPDGEATVTVSATDGAGKTGVGSDALTIDNTAPTAVTGFAAAPGHGKCSLAWTSGTDSNLTGVVVRRGAVAAEYPFYPFFTTNWPDGISGAYPEDETDGIGVYDGTDASHDDIVTDRNIYYYQAFCYDEARNYGPAAETACDLATNYWLGDIADEWGGWLGYDGFVDDGDILQLSGAYWASGPVTYPGDAECDIGPTVHPGGSPLGLPLPDAFVEFEDAMIFAMNYGVASARVVPLLPEAGCPAPLALELEAVEPREGELRVALRLSNNPGTVKGISAAVSYDSSELEFLSGRMTDYMSSPVGQVFSWIGESENSVVVDAAVLGTDVTIGGSGIVAELTFRTLSHDYSLEVESARVRDADNLELEVKLGGWESVDETPVAFRLVGNAPNPFNPVTKIAYNVPRESEVTIRVYDVAGRVVTTLVDGVCEPGRHVAVWDGRNDRGEEVGSGVYFCSMEAPDFHESRKMTLLK